MSQARLEWKVGLFVVLCLGLLGGLVLLFSKGLSPFTPAYALRLKTANAGFIISGAGVRMAGVNIGSVDRVTLDPDGKAVTIWLKILKRYPVHADARFVIEQIGFLGDQFVSVIPRQNLAPLLPDGAEIACEEPFNLQEVARSAMGLITRVDQTVQKLDQAVSRVDQILLSEQTLTNATAAVAQLRGVIEKAGTTLDRIDRLVQTNTAPINGAMSNLLRFSHELDATAVDLHGVVLTNRAALGDAVTNLAHATVTVNLLLDDLQAGKGLAGFLLKDQQIQAQMAALMNNLTTLSSNLNQHGLLYKPRPVRTNAPAPVWRGRSP